MKLPGLPALGLLLFACTIESSVAVAKPAVTFQLTAYSPTVAAIDRLNFTLLPQWDQKRRLTVHFAEWEIRDLDHHRKVGRVPAEVLLWENSGLKDERPKNLRNRCRNNFDEDELRHLGPLAAGHYRMAFLIDGVRLSNVIAFTIDPSFDITKSPALTVGMDEASPGDKTGSLVAWITGPTPEDPGFTNFAVAFADICVDGTWLKPAGEAWAGPVGPYLTGMIDARTYESAYRLKGIDLSIPHSFSLRVGKYVSQTASLNLQSHALGSQWDSGSWK